MWNNDDVAPLDRRYPVYSGKEIEVGDMITHELMAENPDKIENWMRKYPRSEPGYMTLLSVTNVNEVYAEKIVTFKRFPNLNDIAAEKCEGRGKISFGHVSKDRTEVNLTYYGDLLVGRQVHITDIEGAQTKHPKLMKMTAEDEIADWIPLDATYEESDVVPGYEATKLENKRLKDILEEEMEALMDGQGIVFSEDGKSYHTLCIDCEEFPCLWDANQPAMVAFDEAENDDAKQPNQRRHGIYRQMALIINDGPSGRGNRLKLPQCVVDGVRNLFPDPGAFYTGHKEAGGEE
jgi:hypothetical protein